MIHLLKNLPLLKYCGLTISYVFIYYILFTDGLHLYYLIQNKAVSHASQ